jgi:thioredoxin 1
MKKIWKVLIISALALAVGAVIAINLVTQTEADKPAIPDTVNENKITLPRLVDLGADKCIPCKMMVPILDELAKEHVGKLEVVFIDVWKNPAQARKYGINIIPTQVLYDAKGNEVFRHEGFFSKAEILNKFKEFGIKLD